jgi:hypothetical protein
VSDHTAFHDASATAVRWMEMWALEFNTVCNVVHCYHFQILNSSVILRCWHSLNCCTFMVWSKHIICIAVEVQVRHGEPITGILLWKSVTSVRKSVYVCIIIQHFCGLLPELCYFILYTLLNTFLQFVT